MTIAETLKRQEANLKEAAEITKEFAEKSQASVIQHWETLNKLLKHIPSDLNETLRAGIVAQRDITKELMQGEHFQKKEKPTASKATANCDFAELKYKMQEAGGEYVTSPGVKKSKIEELVLEPDHVFKSNQWNNKKERNKALNNNADVPVDGKPRAPAAVTYWADTA
jgi:hypothetical protein